MFSRSTHVTSEKLLAWLLFYVALHDLGKWDVRFQLKAPDVALVLNPLFANADPSQALGFDHGAAGYSWFVKEQPDYGLGEDEESPRLWMRAVAGHHGTMPWDPSLRLPRADKPTVSFDRDARSEWVATLRRIFLAPAGIEPASIPPALPLLLSGFCCVSDWLGSNPDYFPYAEPEVLTPSEYFAEMCGEENAQRALRDSGLWRAPAPRGGMSVLYEDLNPFGVQELVEDLPLEPGLTIVEAPTGSGKTEMALAYASRLLAAGLADSLVFALPTQATANAMFDRLEEVATALFPGDVSLVLAHGKARFNHRFQNLKRAALGLTVQRSEDAHTQCAQWLAQSRKRVFLGQIGACTIDQVLLAALPVRHNFVRRFGVHKSVLIVDEVHAYDAYMNGLLDRVLEGQRDAGGSAILLSATLPSARREELLELWIPTAAPSREMGYSLVTSATRAGSQSFIPTLPTPKRTVGVKLRLAAGLLPDSSLLDEIVQAASAGARVAVVCNLVADAQLIVRQLRDRTPMSIDLFHSRFRYADRSEIERHVLEHYGKSAACRPGRILVATQVVEQSLDLDFDWMVTQLCPVELLFQRIGRLHRHKRAHARPNGYTTPECLILAPPQPEYGYHALVYANVRHLWRTQRLLSEASEITFPRAYREWIEHVFDENPWPGEPTDVLAAHEKYVQEQLGARYKALSISADDAGAFADTEGNATCLTRDSEMSWNVVPVIAGDSALTSIDGLRFDDLGEDWERDWALDQNSIPVPYSWHRYLPEALDGRIYLPMRRSQADIWVGAGNRATFTYSKELGLERSKL